MTFAGERCGRPTALQLTYLHRGSTRSLFVAAVDDNRKAAVDWYNAVRYAKLQYLRIAYPTSDDQALIRGPVSNTFVPPDEFAEDAGSSASETLQGNVCVAAFGDYLTHDFLMEGWLVKAPPRRRDAWCRRWFVLDGRKLSYYVNPHDAYAKGEIFVGSKADGVRLVDGVPAQVADQFELRRVEQVSLETSVSHSPSSNSLGQRSNASANQSDLNCSASSFDDASKSLSLSAKGSSRSLDTLTDEQVRERSFTLMTRERTYVLVAAADCKSRWLTALSSVIHSAPMPKDNVTAAVLVRKRRNDVQSIVSMLKEKL